MNKIICKVKIFSRLALILLMLNRVSFDSKIAYAKDDNLSCSSGIDFLVSTDEKLDDKDIKIC